MKPAIVFVAAFVVATAASTGAKVMMTKPSHPAARRLDEDRRRQRRATDSAAAKPPRSAASDTAHKEAKPAAASPKWSQPRGIDRRRRSRRRRRQPAKPAAADRKKPAARTSGAAAAARQRRRSVGATARESVHGDGTEAGREGARAHGRRRRPDHSRLRRTASGGVDHGRASAGTRRDVEQALDARQRPNDERYRRDSRRSAAPIDTSERATTRARRGRPRAGHVRGSVRGRRCTRTRSSAGRQVEKPRRNVGARPPERSSKTRTTPMTSANDKLDDRASDDGDTTPDAATAILRRTASIGRSRRSIPRCRRSSLA